MKPLLLAFLLAITSACASAPKPRILDEVDAVRNNPATREACELVPQAKARAEKLQQDAEKAWPQGKIATAELLAERALVAYADARELSRIVRAEQQELSTKAQVHQAELNVLKLDAAQKSAAAEAADLDAQLRVLRDAEPLARPEPATPDREQARRVAAKTALSQAQLLCISAKLLRQSDDPALREIDALLGEIASLETKLQPAKQSTPIREAIMARSRCQGVLTEVRRVSRNASPTSEQADQLFVELSAAGLAPSRDDRGIVVTFPKLNAKDAFGRNIAPQLATLGRLAQSHAETPLLVVSHSSKGEPKAQDQQYAEQAAEVLRTAGVNRLYLESVGGRLPVAHPSDLGAANRNERLEVVFVTRL